MEVRFKKLSSIAQIPSYAKIGDAGLDLTATRIISETEEQIIYGTDLAIEIPTGFYGAIVPRSSIRKYQLSLSNTPGTVDSGYRGEIQVTFNKLSGNYSKKYDIGDRVCQIIILEFKKIECVEVEELSESERGISGFGDSGK